MKNFLNIYLFIYFVSFTYCSRSNFNDYNIAHHNGKHELSIKVNNNNFSNSDRNNAKRSNFLSLGGSSYKTLIKMISLFSIYNGITNTTALDNNDALGNRKLLTTTDTLFINGIGGGYNDYGTDIEYDDQENILISGVTSSPSLGSYNQGLAIKQTPSGEILQAKVIGKNTNSKNTYFTGISQMVDGGIGLMGYSLAYPTSVSYYVLGMKLSADWTLEWAKAINFGFANAGFDDIVYSGTSTKDGGLIMSGYYITSTSTGARNSLILKLDSSGNRLWSKYLSYSDLIIRSIKETSTGDYLISGDYVGTAILGKLNSGGGISWLKKLSQNCYGVAVVELSDGNYVYVGYASVGLGSAAAFVLKTDIYGNLLWVNAIGGIDYDYGYAATSTSDRGIVVGGKSNSYDSAFGPTYAGFIFKLNENGGLVWAYVVGGGGDDAIASIQELSNGDLIFTGTTNSISSGSGDVFSIKMNSAGHVLDSCNSIKAVIPTVKNISSIMTFDWLSGYTYAETVPTIYDWNITVENATFLNQILKHKTL